PWIRIKTCIQGLSGRAIRWRSFRSERYAMLELRRRSTRRVRRVRPGTVPATRQYPRRDDDREVRHEHWLHDGLQRLRRPEVHRMPPRMEVLYTGTIARLIAARSSTV